MPCYTANTASVEFNADNAQLLETAVRLLGWTHQRTPNGFKVLPMTSAKTPEYAKAWADGWIEIDLRAKTAERGALNQKNLNLIKREYSRQILDLACKQKGWVYRPAVVKNGQEQLAGQIVRY